MTTELTYDNYLEHYGIKGMRWGVRREVGSDGTITNKVESKNKSKMAKPTRKEKREEKREERRRLKAPNKDYKQGQRNVDRLKYGRHAEKRINRNMNRGDSHREALGKEMQYRKKAAAATAALVTAVYFSPEIASVAVSAINKGYSGLHNAAYERKSQRNKAEAGRRAANAFSDSRGISNYRVIDLAFDSKTNVWR